MKDVSSHENGENCEKCRFYFPKDGRKDETKKKINKIIVLISFHCSAILVSKYFIVGRMADAIEIQTAITGFIRMLSTAVALYSH